MMPRICGPLHQRLGAEAPAQEGRADQDVGRVDAEELGDAALAHGQGLAGRVDGEPVAVPLRHDGVGLHGVVVLGGGLVGGVHPLRRAREAGLDVAAVVDVRRLADADRVGREGLVAVEADAGGLDLVARRQQRHALRRPPPASRRSRPRSPGWRSGRGRSAARPMRNVKGLSLSSGSKASAGAWPGTMTSTTPGCALAAATSSCVTRPRAMVLEQMAA